MCLRKQVKDLDLNKESQNQIKLKQQKLEKLLSSRQDKDETYETQIKTYVKKLIDAKNSIDQLTEKNKSLEVAMNKFKDINRKNEEELEEIKFNVSSKDKLLLAKNDEIIRLSRIISSNNISEGTLTNNNT